MKNPIISFVPPLDMSQDLKSKIPPLGIIEIPDNLGKGKKPENKESISPGEFKTFSIYVPLYNENLGLTIDLPIDQSEREMAMKINMEDIYIRYGSLGLDDLGEAIGKMGEYVTNAKDYQSHMKKVFQSNQKIIVERADQEWKRVEDWAKAIAIDKLDDSINEIEKEKSRYFSEIVDNETGKKHLIFKTFYQGEAEDLIRGLVDLRFLRFLYLKNKKDADDMFQYFLNKNDQDAVSANVGTKASEEIMLKHKPGLARLRQNARDAFQKYIESEAEYRLRYPIINRLIHNQYLPDYPEKTRYYLLYGSLPQEEQDKFLKLQDDAIEIINVSHRSANKIKQAIQGDPSEVWKYPALIQEALVQLNADNTSFISRAAFEKMKEPCLGNWIGEAARLANDYQIITIFLAPCPPALAVAEAAVLIVNLGDIFHKSYDNYRNHIASQAVLDPRKGLMGCPSWGSFLMESTMQLLFSLPSTPKVPPWLVVGAMAIELKKEEN